jgi:hypothetical protein
MCPNEVVFNDICKQNFFVIINVTEGDCVFLSHYIKFLYPCLRFSSNLTQFPRNINLCLF